MQPVWDSVCSIHCPLSNNIPDWLKLTAEGRLQEAYEVSSATNNFPEICGRIWPAGPALRRQLRHREGFESVTIGAVERHITDTAFANGWVKPLRPRQERAQSVGIIGAGPGGLAAAEMLRARGYQVHVYDRYDRVGGLMIYGIPGFKLEKEIVLRRWKLLEEGGIQFHLGAGVGEGVAWDELRARHDSVLIATGVYKPRDIRGPGAGLSGIVPALDFLTASNRKGLGDSVPEFERRGAERRGQACGRDWWRRHGDGLRPHLRPAGSRIGQVLVSAGQGEHARLDAGGEERAGGRGRVRLAVRAGGLPGRYERDRRAGRQDAA